MPRKEIIGILAVILLGTALSALVLSSGRQTSASIDSHGHGDGHDHKHASDKGRHGGKVLTEGNFELEVVVYDDGKNSHFRIYPYEKHKPLNPGEVSSTVETERLDTSVRTYTFRPMDNFLVSNEEIEDPKSFFLKVTAKWKGASYEWEYSQYEGRLSMS